MKDEVYHVFFKDGTSCEKWAPTGEQAKILAQAERIERSQNYEVSHVEYIGPTPT